MAFDRQHMFLICAGDEGGDAWSLLFPEGVHPQLESPEGQCLVSGLRAVFGCKGGDTRGEVADAHGRFPLISILSAWA